MQNYHIIKVKYLSPTNTKGGRTKLISERFPNNSITLSYDYEYNCSIDQAVAWLKSHAYDVIGQGDSHSIAGYVICGTDGNGSFKPLRGDK
jgi:hypothetical protein